MVRVRVPRTVPVRLGGLCLPLQEANPNANPNPNPDPNPSQVLVRLAGVCLPPQEAAAPPPDGTREWQVWLKVRV